MKQGGQLLSRSRSSSTRYLYVFIFSLSLIQFMFHAPDNISFGYDMGWWKEEHFNASDANGDGLLNITEFNE